MDFEFDLHKSATNKDKHGIDFSEAQALWRDEGAISVRARAVDEPRFALIAKINDNHWVAFYTLREGSVRIISVRRARDAEKWRYEDYNSRGTR